MARRCARVAQSAPTCRWLAYARVLVAEGFQTRRSCPSRACAHPKQTLPIDLWLGGFAMRGHPNTGAAIFRRLALRSPHWPNILKNRPRERLCDRAGACLLATRRFCRRYRPRPLRSSEPHFRSSKADLAVTKVWCSCDGRLLCRAAPRWLGFLRAQSRQSAATLLRSSRVDNHRDLFRSHAEAYILGRCLHAGTVRFVAKAKDSVQSLAQCVRCAAAHRHRFAPALFPAATGLERCGKPGRLFFRKHASAAKPTVCQNVVHAWGKFGVGGWWLLHVASRIDRWMGRTEDAESVIFRARLRSVLAG